MDYRRLLARSAIEALEEVGEARLGSPETIWSGEMSQALAGAGRAFKALEESLEEGARWYPVRRIYSGVSMDFQLLARMSDALRLRMHALNTLYVSGLDYFHRRVDRALARGAMLAEAAETGWS